MKQRLKQLLFSVLQKDPEGVVVTFVTGTPEQVSAMHDQIRQLVPDRRRVVIDDGDYLTIRERLRPYRIAQSCVMFNGDAVYDKLRWIALALAPTKILAFNPRLERHHLKPSLASLLFVHGTPKDHIFDRPWSRTIAPAKIQIVEGRGFRDGYPRIGVLTPYPPWPTAHGGAVRMHHLIREAARDFDIVLFSFAKSAALSQPFRSLCAQAIVAEPPQYCKPRWWGLTPPEVREFESPALRQAINGVDLLQVEYTQMARYPGDVLVEHDVTFDLAQQAGKGWDLLRWKLFETRAVRRFRRVVVMSEKDHRLLGVRNARVIPNGVDLERFSPVPETPGRRLLFVSSFAHYPNVVAYRFFIEEIWPRLTAPFGRGSVPEGRGSVPDECTVVAGHDPEFYWRKFTRQDQIPVPTGIDFRAYVADVKPLYDSANLVIVPTSVSAGTNLKVLEGMAAGRAIVSTSSGCAGIGLVDGESVVIADTGERFAAAIERLLSDEALRRCIAENARRLAEERYGWDRIGLLQAEMWRELLAEKGK